MGPQFTRFFEQTVNRYCVNTGYPKEAIAGYWLRRILVATHKGISQALIQRGHRVACRAHLAADALAAGQEDSRVAHTAAPTCALDSLWDKTWDYPAGAGVPAECWRVDKDT